MSTKRNTAYNLGGAIAPVVMMLFSVPLYIGIVGEARYGVLAIVWILTGYFSFFDFGLGKATAFAIAKLKNDSDAMRARAFWTALLINAVFGVVGAAVMYFVAPPLFRNVFNLSPELLAELAPVFPWLALAIPLLTFEGVFTGALTGRERFLQLNARVLVGTAITQFLPLLFVWQISPSLEVAIPATMFARTLSVALLAVVAFRSVPAGFKPLLGDRKMTKELLGYGGWVSISSFLDPIIANFDRFLIAAYLNAVAVSHYTVPYQLVTRGGLFSRALANALFPRMAQADEAEAERLADRAIRANAALMSVLVASGIIIMNPFLSLWINPDFAAAAAPVGEQIAISTYLTAIALIPYNLLQAQGRPKETIVVLVLQMIPYLALAFWGISAWGILGVALARNARSLINLVLLALRTNLLGRVLKIMAAPLALKFVLIAVLNQSAWPSEWRLGLAALIWATLLAISYRIFPEGPGMVLGLARRLLSRRHSTRPGQAE